MQQISRIVRVGWLSAGAALGVSSALAAPLRAQDSSSTAAKVPLKQVAPVEGRSPKSLGAVTSVRGLPDGSVYVNDNQRRQLLQFDGTLKTMRVVADTAPGAPLPYGQRPAGLLPYLGDSTILVDPNTSAMLVLNPQGKVARIMASPRPNDINTLSNVNLGSHAFDSKGQLVYRQGNAGGGGGMAAMFGSGMDRGGGGRGGQPGGQQGQQGRGNPGGQQGRGGDMGGFGGDMGGRGGQPGGQQGGPGGRGFNPQNQPDSVPIVRVNFDTRKADSVAWVKVPKNETATTRGEDGSVRFTSKVNPLPQGDDWVLLSDGTIAVVRVLDYHVDFYTVDGKHEASPRLPFDWKRISDEEKTKMVDSLKTMVKQISDRAAAATGGGGGGFRMNFDVIGADKLPDYYPPVRAGSSIADFDGNLWILPSTSNLSAQLAQQMMMGGGGRGGMGGPPGGGAPGAPGGFPGRGGRDSTQRAPGDTTGRGGRGGDRGGAMGGFAGMLPMPPSAPLVYDVVNRKGELVQRVQLPAGRQLVGFGPKGAIYMTAREGREIFLEKTHLMN